MTGNMTGNMSGGNTQKRTASDPITLFCLPHAGGSAIFYQPLATHLPSWLCLVPLELPGKGLRSGEQVCTNFESIADDAAAQIRNAQQGGGPYALFGHSMGALLAWHLAHVLAHVLAPILHAPVHLFLSSPPILFTQGTQSLRHTTPYHALPSEELLAKLREMGGLPSDETGPELLRYIEPIIRADFTAMATWNPPRRPPLDIPLTLFLGQNETNETDETDKAHEAHALTAHWAGRTCGPFAVHSLPGGHFYMMQQWEQLAALIANCLQETAA